MTVEYCPVLINRHHRIKCIISKELSIYYQFIYYLSDKSHKNLWLSSIFIFVFENEPDVIKTISIVGFDNMKTNKKSVEQIEKEFREEMRELAKQGKLYAFEKAMDNAQEKFENQLKSWREEEIEQESFKEECKKKLSNMWENSKNNKL